MPAPPRIVQAGHPVLRAAAERVDPSVIGTKEIEVLVRRMVEAMRKDMGER